MKLEFDHHFQVAGTVEVRTVCESVHETDELVVQCGADEFVVVSAHRDQWGVFLDVCGHLIAQEDGTRSFLDALIRGLQEIKRRNEIATIPATEAT